MLCSVDFSPAEGSSLRGFSSLRSWSSLDETLRGLGELLLDLEELLLDRGELLRDLLREERRSGDLEDERWW